MPNHTQRVQELVQEGNRLLNIAKSDTNLTPDLQIVVLQIIEGLATLISTSTSQQDRQQLKILCQNYSSPTSSILPQELKDLFRSLSELIDQIDVQHIQN